MRSRRTRASSAITRGGGKRTMIIPATVASDPADHNARNSGSPRLVSCVNAGQSGLLAAKQVQGTHDLATVRQPVLGTQLGTYCHEEVDLIEDRLVSSSHPRVIAPARAEIERPLEPDEKRSAAGQQRDNEVVVPQRLRPQERGRGREQQDQDGTAVVEDGV